MISLYIGNRNECLYTIILLDTQNLQQKHKTMSNCMTQTKNNICTQIQMQNDRTMPMLSCFVQFAQRWTHVQT